MMELGKTHIGVYKYGFNGQEMDDEVAGERNTYTAEFWEYDARIGRRFNMDPKPIISISPYACFANNPIFYSDPNGDTLRAPDGSLIELNLKIDGTLEVSNNCPSDVLEVLTALWQSSSDGQLTVQHWNSTSTYVDLEITEDIGLIDHGEGTEKRFELLTGLTTKSSGNVKENYKRNPSKYVPEQATVKIFKGSFYLQTGNKDDKEIAKTLNVDVYTPFEGEPFELKNAGECDKIIDACPLPKPGDQIHNFKQYFHIVAVHENVHVSKVKSKTTSGNKSEEKGAKEKEKHADKTTYNTETQNKRKVVTVGISKRGKNGK